MAEKSQNAVSGKEKKKEKKITKKRQYNNRKVFRRCRQTLIKTPLQPQTFNGEL